MEIKKFLLMEEMNIDIKNIVDLDNFSSEFICVICLAMVIKPLQLKCCDHLICTGCLKTYIKNNYQILKCPLCKRSLTYETPNKIILRLYSNLKIKCKNKGCYHVSLNENYFSNIFNHCEEIEENIKNRYKYCKQCGELYEINSVEDNPSSSQRVIDIHECKVNKKMIEYKDCKYIYLHIFKIYIT